MAAPDLTPPDPCAAAATDPAQGPITISVEEALSRAAAALAAGRMVEADHVLGAVLEAWPNHPEALHLVGIVAHQVGDDLAAVAWFRRVLEHAPDHAEAWGNLGLTLLRLGQVEDAVYRLRRAAELVPDSAAAHTHLGVALERQERWDDAIACHRRAIALDPAHAAAQFNLGNVMVAAGDLAAAAESYRRAAELSPDFARCWAALGDTLGALGRAADAETALERAVELSPERADWHQRLADLRHGAGAIEGAIVAYQRVVALDPNRTDAWFGLGCAQLTRRNFAAAARALERVLAQAPGHPGAVHNLGQALFELGRVESAIDQFRAAAKAGDAALAGLARQALAVVIPGDPRADHNAVGAARRAWAKADCPSAPRIGVRATGRPPRIGYLCSFFDKANWMKPVWGLINAHDRERVAVHLLSDAPRERLATGYRPHPADRFHDLSGLGTEAAATEIERAGIDLLVDLNGYSKLDRLPLVARRPAPLVVGWFNHYATSGIDAIDVLVGDPTVIPAEEERFYGERIRRVPHSYLAFAVDYPVPPVVAPPCVARGAITFGCLAPQYKITPEVIATLAEILARCPGSRLVLRNTGLTNADNRGFVERAFVQAGVAADRIDLIGPAEHYAFLQTYDAIDIAIDTFPYNGGQTTTEAIWQGVPFLTFWGDRWVGRTSASILRAGGLGGWVAADRAGLVELAVGLATAPDAAARLAAWRSGLRAKLAASPVCDTATLAQAMERIYLDLLAEQGG